MTELEELRHQKEVLADGFTAYVLEGQKKDKKINRLTEEVARLNHVIETYRREVDALRAKATIHVEIPARPVESGSIGSAPASVIWPYQPPPIPRGTSATPMPPPMEIICQAKEAK